MIPAPLASWRSIVTKLFPWLAYVGPSSDGGLSLRAAASKLLHLQGDAGDPAVARVSDGVGVWYAVVVSGAVAALYWSPSNGTTSSWTLVASGASPPVNGVTVGTPVAITTGSGKVTAG